MSPFSFINLTELKFSVPVKGPPFRLEYLISMWIKNICTLLSILLLPAFVSAQMSEGDDYGLLLNPYIRIESTEAINSMYNFEFEKSRRHFIYLKKQYPWHPLPYLLLGLNYWWRMVPNYNNKTWDQEFLAYMDTTKFLAKQLRNEYNQIEGAFFLAASHAFAGRFYSERNQYRKAAFVGKNALKYLGECDGHEEYSPEILFGDALFNYYAQWIRENYPLLRPLMFFFPKGDRQLGIAQLKEVARNAFYSRTEAQYYLMRLLAIEENDIAGALQVATYLHKNYPNNSYFHRFYARLLYQSGRYAQAELVSQDVMMKIDSGYVGYEANTGRHVAFFLGHIKELRKDYLSAKKYYNLGLKYAEEARATERGYYYYSLLHLGNIARKDDDKERAKEYYKRVKKLTRRKHPSNKEAREWLKKL